MVSIAVHKRVTYIGIVFLPLDFLHNLHINEMDFSNLDEFRESFIRIASATQSAVQKRRKGKCSLVSRQLHFLPKFNLIAVIIFSDPGLSNF